MPKTQQRRWVCPHCSSGVLAPSRPRKDDVRRYCLSCSEKTGRLVERSCPALEKQRVASKEKSAARAVSKREAERAKYIDGPYDFVALQRKMAKLPAFKSKRGSWKHHGLPTLELRRSKTKYHSSGHCYYGFGRDRIVVTTGLDPHCGPATLLHEMAHSATFGEHHSALFWSTVRRAAREMWPEATFDFLNARDGWTTQQAIRNGLAELYAKADQ